MSLVIKQLKKQFNTSAGQLKAVDDVSLTIKENQIVGLVGESGSGKSTLGKLIAGLHDKSGGEISWQGDKMPTRFHRKDFERFSGDIQMIFQDPYASLNPRMTVAEIIEEPLLLKQGLLKQGLVQKGSSNEGFNKQKLSRLERQKLVDLWLERVGLKTHFRGRYPHEFSGGQRQRIGIARALIAQPQLLICDEPISALDVSVQAQIVNLLKELQDDLKMSILFIAHDLAMVRYISDEIAVMYLGKVVEQGSALEVFSDPKHPYTQLLIRSNPVADPDSQNNWYNNETDAEIIKGEIPSPINLPAGCNFASRCPKCSSRCETEKPELQPYGSPKQRKIACFNL